MKHVYLALLVPLLLVAGCGGPPSHLETLVDKSEDYIDAADAVLEDRVHDAIQRLEGARRDVALSAYETSVEILWAADDAARAARLALDTWEDIGTERGMALIGCLVVRIIELVDIMEAYGLETPETLKHVAGYAGTFFGHSCAE